MRYRFATKPTGLSPIDRILTCIKMESSWLRPLAACLQTVKRLMVRGLQQGSSIYGLIGPYCEQLPIIEKLRDRREGKGRH